jgi:hypothetical protein
VANYTPVTSYDALRKVLDDKLAEYNDTNTVSIAARGGGEWGGGAGADDGMGKA